jgi:lipopolysaccharide export LptBFGC system permease protein LptF
MGLCLLARTVFAELIKVTALALCGASAVLMAGGAMYEALRHGVDPWRVLAVMPLLIPPTLPFTLPTCVLFACTVVYTRMSANVEITALKASGVHAAAVLWPAVWISAGACALGIILADRFIPACNRLASDIMLADCRGNIYAYLRRYGSIVDSDLPYEVYVRDVRGDRLIRPIIKHRTHQGTYDLVAEAAEATLDIERPKGGDHSELVVAVRLHDGVARVRDGSTVYFRERVERMPVPQSSIGNVPRLANLSLHGCRIVAGAKLNESAKTSIQLAWTGLARVVGGELSTLCTDLRRADREVDRAMRVARQAESEIHLRLVQAAAAIPFVLLGCPASILFHRRDFLHSFFACFLPIITVFYPLLLLTCNFAKEGIGNPGWSVWLPVVLAMCATPPLLWRVIRY